MDVLVPVKAINAAVAEAQAAPAAEVAAPPPVAEAEPIRDLPATLKDPFDPFELTAVCDCHNDHDGRPDEVPDGCGAFVEVASVSSCTG